MTRVAAVDCGTNTIKLLVAELDAATGTARELVRESRMVRLGQDVDRTGRLAEEALVRAFAAVDEYAALIRHHDARAVRFCATSASRDASNAAVFVSGVEERLGVTPEVVSGAEEARLSYAGATRSLTGLTPPVLVVDIGGGSTELVLGDAEGRVSAAHSLDMGSVRMTERHLHSDPPTAAEIAEASASVDAALATLPAYGVELATARTGILVSGTGLTVSAAALDLPALDWRVDGQTVPVASMRSAVQQLLAMSVAVRRALPYMHRGREDVIGAGALIVDRVVARTSLTEVRASVRDILDGIAWSCVRGG